VVGAAMIATWQNCAGPCGKSILVDSNGKTHGAWFGGGEAIDLGHQLLAITPTADGATFRVIDALTGAPIPGVPADAVSAAALDDRTVITLRAATAKGQSIWEVRSIGAVVSTVAIPTCKPRP
jgi:hypothetical protein